MTGPLFTALYSIVSARIKVLIRVIPSTFMNAVSIPAASSSFSMKSPEKPPRNPVALLEMPSFFNMKEILMAFPLGWYSSNMLLLTTKGSKEVNSEKDQSLDSSCMYKSSASLPICVFLTTSLWHAACCKCFQHSVISVQY